MTEPSQGLDQSETDFNKDLQGSQAATFPSSEAISKDLDRVQKKIETTTAKIERNWFLQLALFMVGVAFPFRPDLGNQIAQVVRLPAVAITYAIPIFLTYLFSAFGFLLCRFFLLRLKVGTLIDALYRGNDFDSTLLPIDLKRIVAPVTIFEAWYLFALRTDEHKRKLKSIGFTVIVVTIVIVYSANHALVAQYALTYYKIFPFSEWLFLSVFVLIHIAMYVTFYSHIPDELAMIRRQAAMAPLFILLLYYSFTFAIWCWGA
ncbi:MAG: hypothetical protein AAGG48_00020 [Planctomycetota bacterium]